MSYDISKVLTIAEQELGYLEKKSNKNLDSKTGNAGSNNFTKYWRDLAPSFQKQPWCDAFVSWCFLMAYGRDSAQKLLCGGLDSYLTATSAKLFDKNEQWFASPKTGDQIFFKNSKRIYHTGIVYYVDKRYVYTIEGNTSGASGVVPNGGGVCKKKYSLNDPAIAGYGRPAYGTQTAPAASYPMWIKSGSEWYYRISEGKNAHGWRNINGHRYYFDKTGRMAKEWRQIDGKWYYFQPESGKGEALAGALYITDSTGAQRIMEVDR